MLEKFCFDSAQNRLSKPYTNLVFGALRKIFLLLVLNLFCGIGICSEGNESSVKREVSPIPWRIGEKLTFEIKWGVIPAGEATLEVGEPSQMGVGFGERRIVKAYPFVATAKSNSFLDVFYKVRDINKSWLDSQDGVSHRFEQHNQEGKYVLDQVVEFDWENGRFRNVEKVKGREAKIEEGELTIPAVDTLSSLYLTRLRKLKEGEEFKFDVHSGKNWPLVIKVLKREKVKVPAGTFDCFLVEPFLRERGLFIQKGKKLQVWMTADEKQIPVLMKAEIFIGHISAELKKIQ